MRILSRLSVAVLAGFFAVACGGSPAPTTGATPDGNETGGDPSVAPIAADTGGEDVAGQPAVEPAGHGGSPTASGPDTGDDCLAFHIKLVECQKAEGGSGTSEEAEMLGAARDGCRDAYADRNNPVTAFIIELWSECGQLSCAEIEDCFLGGMMRLSAPPGPYVPSPQ